MKPRFEQLAKLCRRHGLTAVDRGEGHWQVTGGPLLVNVYPYAKNGITIYVAGTLRGFRGTLARAVQAARELPKARGERDRRRTGSYRRIRMLMLMRDDKCFWCRKPLTVATSTVDHRIPISRGGLDNANNRVLACLDCNQRRKNYMPELRETCQEKKKRAKERTAGSSSANANTSQPTSS